MKPTLHLTVAAIVLATFYLSAATRYVWQDSPSPGPPYTNWATAARVVQDAVDAAAEGNENIVTGGLYATGGRAVGTNTLVNRVAVDKPLTLRSVAGVDYFLERATNLSSAPLFTPLATGIPGIRGTTTYTDTNATCAGSFFYRVGVGQ